MTDVSVNWLAVLGGVVISMILGWLWYSPMAFGKMWMEELGKKKMELGDAKTGYLAMIIASAVLTYVMIHFASYAGATSASTGAMTGFWLWLGFVAATGVGRTLFRGDSFKLFAIDYGYNLVQFVLIGMLVATWK